MLRDRYQALLIAGLSAMLVCEPIYAEAGQCLVSSEPESAKSSPELPNCSQLYPQQEYPSAESSWKIGLGLGYGQRSNPLINSDDIPIYGILQLSYFGEHLFFDNGDVGWFVSEGEHWSLNAIAGVGGERSFYSFLNDGSVGFNPGFEVGSGENVSEPGTGPFPDPGNPSNTEVERAQAPERDITVDGGLEWLYSSGRSEFQVQLLTDISGRHHGQEAWLSWARVYQAGKLQLVPSIGLNWKSARAANYYYGVKDREASILLMPYEVNSATNVFARIGSRYPLNDHWNIIGVFQYEKLDDSISNSPAVEDDYVSTAFLGLYYEF